MGSKFKVGDRVRVVEGIFSQVPVGTVGFVSRVESFVIVPIGDEEWYFVPDELELAPVEQTVKELVEQAIERVRRVQDGQRDEGAREMALAITHLEDGLMRFTRGMAMRLGVFSPADLEKIGDDPQAASAFLAERDQKASDAAQVQA